MLEFLIHFIEKIEISTKCVLIFSSLSYKLVLWYELNKHFVVFSNTTLCK